MKQRWRWDAALAVLLLRLLLGVNLAMHGISRLLHGPGAFAHSLLPMFHATFLPGWALMVFGYGLPWAEALTGVLLLAGFAVRFACVFGLLQLLALTFGSALRQDWSAAGIQLGFGFIYAVLLALRELDRFSLDSSDG
jgi:thiosulfate dehydrogenase [quinone] large subunit